MSMLTLLPMSLPRAVRGRGSWRADLIAGMSDVKAAEGCRSPNRWRGAPRTEHGEAFGLRQSSAALGSVAAKAKTAEDKGSPKRCVFRAAHRDHFRIQSSCASG